MTAKRLILGLLSCGWLLSVAACSDVTLEPDTRGTAVRLGKADGAASCKGACGKQAPGGCWCDAACAQYGDCCADKSEACDARPGSCKNSCGAKSPDGCWCDTQCAAYGDCCKDIATQCKPTTKTCTKDANCGANEFCKFETGACQSPATKILTGTCAPTTQICVEIYAPVCGCDGKTYGNSCNADAAGVSVAKLGECGPVTTGCSKNSECNKGEFCAKADGNCDGKGKCTQVPQACTMLIDPVCGCDNKDYSNACFAATAGANVKSKGTCKPNPTGCTQNSECNKDEFCKFNDGACLISSVAPKGTCTKKPQACTMIYAPVCGCDDKTYSSDCFAFAAGESVAKKGECYPPATGCASNKECGNGAYCAKAAGDCNGKGKCAPIPQACTMQIDTVCGCDGAEYSNPCFAASSGVNVANQGTCNVTPTCAGAWVDAQGACRAPNGATYPAKCCNDLCTGIASKHSAAIIAAQSCSPFVTMLQCQFPANNALYCGCPTFVNSDPKQGDIAKYTQEFASAGCSHLPVACPPMPCPVAKSATCDLTTKVCKTNP